MDAHTGHVNGRPLSCGDEEAAEETLTVEAVTWETSATLEFPCAMVNNVSCGATFEGETAVQGGAQTGEIVPEGTDSSGTFTDV